MKTFLRIVRALFIRLIFMAFSLLCIWRVTFVSDNKFYWLMVISVGFLLIETAVLLWLRAGKEFKGILPSVLFFLACVLPSIWIISIDEATRKNRFHYIVGSQENSIKDYVLSLDIANNRQPIHPQQHYTHNNPRLMSNFSKSTTTTAAATSAVEGLVTAVESFNLSTMAGEELLIRLRRAAAGSKDLMPVQLALAASHTNAIANPKYSHRKMDPPPHHRNNPHQTRTADRNIDCCDVKISYWFQEDNFQHLFFQTLMLILIVSRWLITRAELTLNQRSLILVISVATAADTLDFFSYLNLEMVYRSSHLLYSVLLIISLSLIQFVFLHVEDSLSGTYSSNASPPTRTANSLNNVDNDDELNDNELNSKEKLKSDDLANLKKNSPSSKFSLFNRQYEFLKKHLKAEQTLNRMNGTNFLTAKSPFMIHKTPPLNMGRTRHCFCSFFCCCLEQQDPLFFILLASIFLHDGSYLTFRIFALSKLGLQNILNQSPLLIFFLIKNILIIVTQIYKVYTVTSERRQRKIIENYRDLVMAAHEGIGNAAAAAAAASAANLNMANNFLPTSQSAAIAAAATGGQVPLIGGLNHFPTNNNNNNNNNNAAGGGQAYFAGQGQPMSESPGTNNPYRFAQIYNDPFSVNKPYNRSVSTLGTANVNYFTANRPNQGSFNMGKSAQEVMNQKSSTLQKSNTNMDTSMMNNNPYYANNQSTCSYQSQSIYQQQSSLTSPYTESLLGMMNKEFNTQNYVYQQQQQPSNAHIQSQPNAQAYDQNITLCQSVNTPMNPFSAKVGKAIYGLPFANRNNSNNNNNNNNYKNENNANGGFNMANNLRNSGHFNHNQQNNNNNNNNSKILKASKI